MSNQRPAILMQNWIPNESHVICFCYMITVCDLLKMFNLMLALDVDFFILRLMVWSEVKNYYWKEAMFCTLNKACIM